MVPFLHVLETNKWIINKHNFFEKFDTVAEPAGKTDENQEQTECISSSGFGTEEFTMKSEVFESVSCF